MEKQAASALDPYSTVTMEIDLMTEKFFAVQSDFLRRSQESKHILQFLGKIGLESPSKDSLNRLDPKDLDYLKSHKPVLKKLILTYNQFVDTVRRIISIDMGEVSAHLAMLPNTEEKGYLSLSVGGVIGTMRLSMEAIETTVSHLEQLLFNLEEL